MSKATLSLGQAAPRREDDAFSMHSQLGHSFLGDDGPEIRDDDLPPLYDEVDAPNTAPLLPPELSAHSSIVPFKVDESSGAQYFLGYGLDEDPKKLEDQIKYWARFPPRPYVRILGTHTESRDNAGKKERKTVTDFDVFVELTPYLYSNAATRTSWTELRTVENEEKTRRGTVFRKRAPGAKKQVELGVTKPTLAEWCHRYTASHSGLKCFVLQRKMTGFDQEHVQKKLEALVRSTNYRGHVKISFPVKDATVEVYNDCKTNAWRLTSWILWLSIFTLMFIFTWPCLFFSTKRFEVAVAEWTFSKADAQGRRQFVSISEDQWYNMWGRAIHRAVLEKRSATLDQQDLIADEGADTVPQGSLGDFVAFGVRAMNEVNRQLGWGDDS